MKKINLQDIILLVLSLLLAFGTEFFFHACPAKDDGSWMRCHWAENAVFAIGIALSVLVLARFFISDQKIKAGISFSFLSFHAEPMQTVRIDFAVYGVDHPAAYAFTALKFIKHIT